MVTSMVDYMVSYYVIVTIINHENIYYSLLFHIFSQSRADDHPNESDGHMAHLSFLIFYSLWLFNIAMV